MSRSAPPTVDEFGIPVDLKLSQKRQVLSSSAAHELMMIAREAVTNAGTHGSPSRITISAKVGACAQKLAVAGIAVVLVEMRAELRSTHLPVGPCRRTDPKTDRIAGAPDVDVMVRDPSRQVIGLLSCPLAVRVQFLDETNQRLGAIAQIAAFHRLVVHLDIDIRGPVAAPGRRDLIVPNALQIGRLRTRSGSGNQKVASVLEVERQQRGIRRNFKLLEPLAGWQLRTGAAAQIERNPIEKRGSRWCGGAEGHRSCVSQPHPDHEWRDSSRLADPCPESC